MDTFTKLCEWPWTTCSSVQLAVLPSNPPSRAPRARGPPQRGRSGEQRHWAHSHRCSNRQPGGNHHYNNSGEETAIRSETQPCLDNTS